jgi:NAD(P)-dependent dehydrogenase (short-subunit alcohol dehydrogenase family)
MSERVALVTGASRGIGRGIALALAAQGWAIVVNYRGQADAAQQTARAIADLGSAALVVQADVSLSEDRARLVQATLAEFGRLDLLVNNAGMAPRQRMDLLATTEASYDEVMEVNLKGPFFLTQLAANAMIELLQKDAALRPKIVNIGSISAYAASTNRGEYCISKAGLGMMTALFADRLAEYGIQVFEVRPGVTATDMTSKVKERYDEMIAAGLTPIRRWGEPDDIARAVVAIAQGYFPFSTGEVINVDGGFHLRRL